MTVRGSQTGHATKYEPSGLFPICARPCLRSSRWKVHVKYELRKELIITYFSVSTSRVECRVKDKLIHSEILNADVVSRGMVDHYKCKAEEKKNCIAGVNVLISPGEAYMAKCIWTLHNKSVICHLAFPPFRSVIRNADIVLVVHSA